MRYKAYITVDGDRWDSIAAREYGDAGRSAPIKTANPGVPIFDVLPGGINLRIPILEKPAESTINKNLLPPWAR